MTQDTRGVEESVSLAIEAALDLSDELKAYMRGGGDFDKAARAAIAAMSRPEAVTDEMVEALSNARTMLQCGLEPRRSMVEQTVAINRALTRITAALSKASPPKPDQPKEPS